MNMEGIHGTYSHKRECHIYIQYIYNLNENENVCGMVAIFCRNDCDNMGEKITIKFAYTRAH